MRHAALGSPLLVLLLAGLTQAAPRFAGDYRLWDQSFGAPVEVALTVREDAGALSVTRAQSWGWGPRGHMGEATHATLESREVALQGDVLCVTYRRSAGPGGLSRLGGEAQENVFHATYRLFDGGLRLEETVENTTRLAPDDGWSVFRARGLRTSPGPQATRPRVTTLVRGGDPKFRYDLVIVSDAYAGKDLARFRQHAAAVVDALRATTPFREYWSYLNVFLVEVPAARSGLAGGPSALGTRAAGERKIDHDTGRILDAARLAPGCDAALVLVNHPFRSYAKEDVCLVSTTEDRYPRVSVHELGHTIGKLLDEYEEEAASPIDFLVGNAVVEAFTKLTGWGANVTTHTSPDAIPWRRWLTPGAPLPTPTGSGVAVGLYRGALHRSRFLYRPSEICRMRDTREPFCPVCCEALVLRLSEKAMPFTLRKTRIDRERWRIEVPSIQAPYARVRWYLDGSPRTNGDGLRSVTISRDDLSWGDHQVAVEVLDASPFVRNGEGRTVFRAGFLARKGYIWDKTLDLEGPYRIQGLPSRPADPMDFSRPGF